jgi:hypothetical protein
MSERHNLLAPLVRTVVMKVVGIFNERSVLRGVRWRAEVRVLRAWPPALTGEDLPDRRHREYIEIEAPEHLLCDTSDHHFENASMAMRANND